MIKSLVLLPLLGATTMLWAQAHIENEQAGPILPFEPHPYVQNIENARIWLAEPIPYEGVPLGNVMVN